MKEISEKKVLVLNLDHSPVGVVNVHKGFVLTYCGSEKDLTLDHVIPKSKGGKTSWKNLITACHRCNTIKGNKTPEEAGMPLVSFPFKPNLSYFLAEYAERHATEWIPFLAIKEV